MLTLVDPLIASHLGIGELVRYCDDVLVFHDDPEVLRAAWDAVRRRCEALRLRLHPRKCRLHRTTHRTTEPVAFLGFVLQRCGDAVSVRMRKENLRRFRAGVRELRLLYALGALGAEEVVSRVRAWLAAGAGPPRRTGGHERAA